MDLIQNLPERIETEKQLDDLLTQPSPRLIEFIKTLSSPLIILGAGGKMGPTMALLAKRSADAAKHPLEVIAVSRFTDPSAKRWLEDQGVKTLSCDLLEEKVSLPEAENVIYCVGLKFGTAQNPGATWAMNTIVPARVVERYPQARIVALSTGNVYPLQEVSQGGALENARLVPLGEYANAAVGRERIFEFYSHRYKTSVALLRLCYAVELRYGVLVDIARKVHAGEPVELVNGYFNCIWQGDANEMVLRSLSLTASPPSVWNLSLAKIFSVRAVASRFGELLGRHAEVVDAVGDRAPRFTGTESPTALIVNSGPLCAKLGNPEIQLETMLPWIAHWVKKDGANLGKPTHFEERDGNY